MRAVHLKTLHMTIRLGMLLAFELAPIAGVKAAALPNASKNTNESRKALAVLGSGPMVGFTDMTTSTIWVQANVQKVEERRLDRPVGAKLVYWPEQEARNPSVEHRLPLFLKKEEDYIGRFRLTNLTPGVRYAYQVELDGRVASPILHFKTQPRWQWRKGVEPPDFTTLLGSCNYVNEPEKDREGTPYGGNYEIFNAMAAKDPDLMLWLGDNVYLRESDYTNPEGISYRYRHDRALPGLQALLRTGQHLAIWDDHDYGPNDANSSFHLKNESLSIFRRYWANPGYGIPDVPGIFTSFSWGDVDFFLLDNRWYRDSDRDRATANKQMFGPGQMRWLKNALLVSTATFKVIAGGSQFLNDANPYEGWNHFTEEREDFLGWLEKNKVNGVLFVSGDRHHSELIQRERGKNYPLYDLTCSPLTAGTHKLDEESRKSGLVAGTLVGEHNFCSMSFSGPHRERQLTLRVFDSGGRELWSKTLAAEELRAK